MNEQPRAQDGLEATLTTQRARSQNLRSYYSHDWPVIGLWDRDGHRTVVDIMMPRRYRRDVRTALTLDEDIAAKLQAESRRSGRSFRDVVNETLRRGLLARGSEPASKPKLPRFSLGLRPGIDLDNAERVLDDLSQGDVP